MKKLLTIFTAAALTLSFAAFTGCHKQTEESEESEPSAPAIETIEGRQVISEANVNTFRDEYFRLLGRTVRQTPNMIRLPNAGTGFEVSFYGTQLTAHASTSDSTHYFRCFIDGADEGQRLSVDKSGTDFTLATGLENKMHTVRVVKATSSQNGEIRFSELKTDGKFVMPEEKSYLKMEFVGDSITVGAGVFATSGVATAYENSDATKAYSYLTAKAFDATYSLVATEGISTKQKPNPYLSLNMIEMYGQISSTNSTPYAFRTQQDVVVVALGTNDQAALSANYGQAEFAADYLELLELIRTKNPDAVIVCIYGMMYYNTTIENGIKSAIENADDEKISYFKMPVGNGGGDGHPSESDAAKQGAALTEYLKTIL